MQSHTSVIELLETRRFLDTTLSNGVLTILGTDGDDFVTFRRQLGPSGQPQIVVNLNNDDDTYDRQDVNVIVASMGRGNDSFIMGTVDVGARVRGGRGDDAISGGAASDTLLGEGGFDYLFGGAGDDQLFGGSEGDEMLGGAGERDLVDYSLRDEDLEISIGDGDDDDGENGEDDNVFADVEIVHGGSGDDRISVASGRRTTMAGGSGDDTLTGGRANNQFEGGAGNDEASGYDGNDTFFMEDGQGDTLEGGRGTDAMDIDNGLDVSTSVETNI